MRDPFKRMEPPRVRIPTGFKLFFGVVVAAIVVYWCFYAYIGIHLYRAVESGSAGEAIGSFIGDVQRGMEGSK